MTDLVHSLRAYAGDIAAKYDIKVDRIVAAADEIERLRDVVDGYADPDGRYVVLCDDGSLIATDELMAGDQVLVDRGGQA